MNHNNNSFHFTEIPNQQTNCCFPNCLEKGNTSTFPNWKQLKEHKDMKESQLEILLDTCG